MKCPVAYCEKKINVRGLCANHANLCWRMSIPPEELAELLGDGLCDICNRFSKPSVDHDHACCPGNYSCGKCIRGVLCHACNRTLGLLREDRFVLNRMVSYLDSEERIAVGQWQRVYTQARKHKGRG